MEAWTNFNGMSALKIMSHYEVAIFEANKSNLHKVLVLLAHFKPRQATKLPLFTS